MTNCCYLRRDSAPIPQCYIFCVNCQAINIIKVIPFLYAEKASTVRQKYQVVQLHSIEQELWSWLWYYGLSPEVCTRDRKLHATIIYDVYIIYWVCDKHLKPHCCNSTKFSIPGVQYK